MASRRSRGSVRLRTWDWIWIGRRCSIGAIQASYNFDCCGFSVEYRKYELGSVRNENAYRFNLSLANIGTAGNLKRAERLF